MNDGSQAQYRSLYDRLESEYGCLVLHHFQNKGKGAALKTGIRAALNNCPMLSGVVTADADGQHTPEDIVRLVSALPEHSGSLILAARGLSSGNVPLHNLLGNRITSLVFFFCTQIFCADTQTGLRAIPARLLNDCLSIPGDRYEYEMNMLCAFAGKGVPFVMLPIKTVYHDRNASSHFRPLRDSARIYRNLLKFGASSLLSAAADLILFSLLASLLFGRTSGGMLFSTLFARAASGVLNFALNRNWSFASRGRLSQQGFKYFSLFIVQMLLSSYLVTLLSALPLPLTVLKIFADCVLFGISFLVQRILIFPASATPQDAPPPGCAAKKEPL